jgi:hypothetical protein
MLTCRSELGTRVKLSLLPCRTLPALPTAQTSGPAAWTLVIVKAVSRIDSWESSICHSSPAPSAPPPAHTVDEPGELHIAKMRVCGNEGHSSAVHPGTLHLCSTPSPLQVPIAQVPHEPITGAPQRSVNVASPHA